MRFMSFVLRIYCRTVGFAETAFAPVLFFYIRFWMARIFFKSGLLKWGSWQSTLSLFRFEYKTPFLIPEVAAILATGIELVAPVLLVLGLATRLASFSMLIMAVVIQLTYTQLDEHIYWMMLLGILVLKGPGSISLDYWICRRWRRRSSA